MSPYQKDPHFGQWNLIKQFKKMSSSPKLQDIKFRVTENKEKQQFLLS